MQDFWKKELLGQGQMWKSTETSLKPLWCVTASCLFSYNKMRSTGQPCSIGSAKPLPSICLSSKDPDFLQDPGLLASAYHTDSIGRTVRSTVSATWLIWAELICDLMKLPDMFLLRFLWISLLGFLFEKGVEDALLTSFLSWNDYAKLFQLSHVAMAKVLMLLAPSQMERWSSSKLRTDFVCESCKEQVYQKPTTMVQSRS